MRILLRCIDLMEKMEVSNLAIVFGFTGLNVSQSFFTAVEIGEHPVA